MITETSGNLLLDDAQALVNTVNTVGVMGKGIALQVKRAFPEVFAAYATACANGLVRPGHVLPVQISGSDRWVLNFPTKRHWREKSHLDDIRAGLDDLAQLLVKLDIRSVAIPPLGCGNGGLRWSQIRPLILEKLDHLDIDIRLYQPGTPSPREMPTTGQPPALTQWRARLLAGLSRYVALAFESGVTESPRLSLLEAHKVAYLLQGFQIDLGLHFHPHRYGPFSASLNRELANMEGHYLIGYGDGTGGARADLRVLPNTTASAEAAVAFDADFDHGWNALRHAIFGYEYPEGMELLATIHYLAAKGGHATDSAALTDELANWSPRKQQMFRPPDVTAALTRLKQAELLV